MRRLLVPLMRPEDPVLWGILALVACYAVAGAIRAYLRTRGGTAATREHGED